MIDVARRVVTMDLRVGEVGGAAALCSLHADKVIPPREWTLDDQRAMVPELFPTPQRERGGVFDAIAEGELGDDAKRRKRRRRRRSEGDEGPEFLVGGDEQLAFDKDDDRDNPSGALDGLGDDIDDNADEPYDLPEDYVAPKKKPVEPDKPTGPLLARAFDNAKGHRTPKHLAADDPPAET